MVATVEVVRESVFTEPTQRAAARLLMDGLWWT